MISLLEQLATFLLDCVGSQGVEGLFLDFVATSDADQFKPLVHLGLAPPPTECLLQ